MIILMHSSKTMRQPASGPAHTGTPALVDRAEELVGYLRTLKPAEVARVMKVSGDLAAKVCDLHAEWSSERHRQAPAAATFVGDIYSGLRVDTFTAADRAYADKHVRILSGLYGIVRPFDGICPYRLEMGYRLPAAPYANLYRYWGTAIAEQLPAKGRIVNLAAGEYSRTVLPHVDADRVVTPRFLTRDAASGEARFVVVHAKIARGAFARWLVTGRVKEGAVRDFAEIGYRYDEKLSTPAEPAFVCEEFGGKGLSVRLT